MRFALIDAGSSEFPVRRASRSRCRAGATGSTSRWWILFKTLKSDLVWRTVFQTRAEATRAIGGDIDGFYNPVRRRSALDLLSPAQFERRAT